MALIQASDMSYLGSFPLPAYAGTPQDEDHQVLYGGMALGLGADGSSLYIGGYDVRGGLARFSIPAIGQAASVLDPMVIVPGTFDVSPNAKFLGGSLVWNGRLIVTKFGYYSNIVNGESEQVASHTSANLDLTGWTTPQPTNAVNLRASAGYMGVIPAEWQAAFGAPCFTGSGPRSITSNGCSGPGLFVFDPDDVTGTGTIPVQTGLFYDVPHLVMQASNGIGGVAWIGDSVIFIGNGGAGNPEYQQTGITDPCFSSPGYHDYPYDLHAWAYDANDLLAVKNGTLQPWEPSWYADWTLPGYNSAPCALINHRGGCYDPATGRYFLCQAFGESPTVHVYEFNTEAPPPAIGNGGPVVSRVISFL